MTMAKQDVSTAVPRLRFPEFRKAAAWKSEKLEELIETVSPPVKLPSSSYLTTGRFPIIDQSQDDICGWTDDVRALVKEPLPLIVFGDHTCALKFVDRPFAQGADGIKILAARPAISIEYLFHSLNHQPLVMEDYKRHFSTLKERQVFYPSVESGEQQKIAECLTSLDEMIVARGRKVAALKAHKRGLMQQLFPREGKTCPRLRLPEFRDAPQWEEASIGSRSKSFSGGTPVTTERSYYGGAIPFIRSAEIGRETTELFLTEDGLQNSAAKLVEKGDVLVALYGANSGDVALARTAGAINQAVLCIRPQGSKAYLYHFLTAKKAWIIATFIQGGQGNLSGEILRSITLQFPSAKEQERIADCLSSLDTWIDAESDKLAALKIHKQGLMKQLFPSNSGLIW